MGRLHSFANFGLRVGWCDLQMCAMWVGVSFFFVGGKKKNKINSIKFALSYQKAKSLLISILPISYLSARLSFYTCCNNGLNMVRAAFKAIHFQFKTNVY